VPYGIVLRFEGVSEQDYWRVNDRLGLTREWTADAWPDGLLSHTGGPTPTGWLITEVWAAKGDQERFMASRLGAALAAEAQPEPVQVIESELVNYQKAT
jgi:hypothetical protein